MSFPVFANNASVSGRSSAHCLKAHSEVIKTCHALMQGGLHSCANGTEVVKARRVYSRRCGRRGVDRECVRDAHIDGSVQAGHPPPRHQSKEHVTAETVGAVACFPAAETQTVVSPRRHARGGVACVRGVSSCPASRQLHSALPVIRRHHRPPSGWRHGLDENVCVAALPLARPVPQMHRLPRLRCQQRCQVWRLLPRGLTLEQHLPRGGGWALGGSGWRGGAGRRGARAKRHAG